MAGLFRRFVGDEMGAVSIEYSLIAGIMAIAVATAFPAITEGLQTGWSNTRAFISGAFG